MASDPEQMTARKTRLVALVIAASMMFWIGAQWIGGMFGITVRFQILIDLIAIAAFIWALAVIYQIWRARQGN
jgi:hypothetical protein